METAAVVLAKFTDLLNQFGADSKQVRAMRKKHETDPELCGLFETTVVVQAQLRAGKLKANGRDFAIAASSVAEPGCCLAVE
ncbi:MAG: hypothetical protein HY744_21860 [Deltaproteobacteria bacterium]|nr:hypothetical protein [Deltaproteobacteria bacterium]